MQANAGYKDTAVKELMKKYKSEKKTAAEAVAIPLSPHTLSVALIQKLVVCAEAAHVTHIR